MKCSMLNYYFFKKIINKLPNQIKAKYNYDNDLLFNLASFNDLEHFYKILNPIKIDKYKINTSIKNNFNDFILYSINIANDNKSLEQLFFIYAIISNYILMKNITPYLKNFTTKKNNIDKIYNMLDFYYASKEDNLDLTKIKLTDYFPNGFIYHDYMDELLNHPVALVANFLCTKQYFNHSMKRKKYYYDKLTTYKYKKAFFYLYDLIFNHKGKVKASTYIYSKLVDTTIFNLNKTEYKINDTAYNYTFYEVYDLAFEEAYRYIEAINQYIYFNNERPLKKLLNVNKI